MPRVLSTGTNALLAFQRALATTSHNVANIKTEGYSRQKVDFATRAPTDAGYARVGNGTMITDVRRVADQLAISRLLDSGGELARLQQLSTMADRVDALFSDAATNLTGVWSNFFDAVNGLSANAAGAAAGVGRPRLRQVVLPPDHRGNRPDRTRGHHRLEARARARRRTP